MISAFRNIRSSLINKSAGGRYALYAIGEILLVVVGILIALQVNNWNEWRKERIEEYAILKQLKEDFESNLDQLESKISIRGTLIESSQKTLEFIDNPGMVQEDSLYKAMSRGGYRPTFDPIENEVISSGKLGLISNNKLRRLLSQWEKNVFQLNEEEQFWKNYCIDHRLPLLAEMGLTRKLFFTSSTYFDKPYLLEQTEENPIFFSDTKKQINVQSILKDDRLEAISTVCIYSATDANLISETIKNYIQEILSLINQDL